MAEDVGYREGRARGTGKTERGAVALDSRTQAAVALNRFGFMPKAGNAF